MARVFGMLCDGFSIAFGEMATHGETWVSLADAKRDLLDRYETGSYRSQWLARVVDIDEDGIARPGAASDGLLPALSDLVTVEIYAGVWDASVRGWRIDESVAVARLRLVTRADGDGMRVVHETY